MSAGEVMWTAGQVARRLRIAESTLRSWHRRYGLGPHAGRPGQYRRYTAADVAQLQRMRDLITAGMLPSDAARRVDSSLGDAELDEYLVAALTAARALESARCLDVVEQAMRRHGVVATWERVCRPALAAVDGDQRDDVDCVDREHILSWAISAALHRAYQPLGASAAPPVMLACTENEQHSLPLEALTAALTECQTPVRMLGAAVPTASLVHAVAAAEPGVVVLWAQRAQTAQQAAVRALRPFHLRQVVAGPGWPARTPAGVARVNDLAEAVALLAADPRPLAGAGNGR